MTDKELRWHRHFITLAIHAAQMSKDPSTKVGAVIIKDHRYVVSTGFNGFPIGFDDRANRLNDREYKNKLIIHAERNAVLQAARRGTATEGCSLYLAAIDTDGNIWGGPPCHRCMGECVQAGIVEYISVPRKAVPSRWEDSLLLSELIIEETGVKYTEIKL